MRHRVIQRIDTREIFRVEIVLRAGPMTDFRAQIIAEQRHHRIEHAHRRLSQLAAPFLKQHPQFRIDHRVQHQSRRRLDLNQGTLKLFPRAHQRIDMLDRSAHFELRARSLGDGIQRFTCRIRHKMKMKIDGNAARFLHGDLRTACEYHRG